MSDTKYSPRTAIAVVVANMIGVGVFTSLGFQLLDIQSGFVLLALWAVGGITALCGALSYAELGSALPRSGGEYNFLSEIFHPAFGFIAGWVSATVGFAAPSALVAMTFGLYLQNIFPDLPVTWSAFALIFLLTLLHAKSRKSSANVQGVSTALKLVLIVIFCLLALVLVETPQNLRFMPIEGDGVLLTSSAFAVSLIYVNYAYTGWNAATYISSELENPQKNLPKVLLVGTVVVAALYLLLHFTFLSVAPISVMTGEEEVGYVAAEFAFGPVGAKVMAIILAVLLVSTVSAMVLAGPRVLQVIGEDNPLFKGLAKTNHNGLPYVAIWVQGAVSLLFILTSSFRQILVFSSFTMGLTTFVVVIGLFVLRIRRPELERPFRVPLYPIPPLIFLGLMGWTLVYILQESPVEGYMGIGVIAIGGIFYALTRLVSSKRDV